MSKPILCLDFDGVLHSYASGWTGPGEVRDPPFPGAITFVRDATVDFRVCIFSSRSAHPEGILAMNKWLLEWAIKEFGESSADWVSKVEWPTEKPSAFIGLDDRVLTFTGQWPSINELKTFKPWYKRGSDAQR